MLKPNFKHINLFSGASGASFSFTGSELLKDIYLIHDYRTETVDPKDQSINSLHGEGYVTLSHNSDKSALEFDGDTACLDIDNYDSSILDGKLTIFARFWAISEGESSGRIISFRGEIASTPGLGLGVLPNGRVFAFCSTGAGTLCNSNSENSAFPFGQWNTVICEWDNTETNKVPKLFIGSDEINYVDYNTSTDALIPPTTDSFAIGNMKDHTRTFDGFISCVYIWNRHLTDDEKDFLVDHPFFLDQLAIENTSPFKIGFATDIHHQDNDELNIIDDFIDRMNDEFTPNVVAIGGDNTHYDVDTHAEQMALLNPVLSKWENLNMPYLLSVGNHEFDRSSLAEIVELISENMILNRLYGSRSFSNINFIILDSQYDSETSGYPHDDNISGNNHSNIIPDGTNGSHDQVSFLESTLDDSKLNIIVIHKDLAAIDLSGHPAETIPETARLSNSDAIRTIIESTTYTVLVLSGHTHWFRTKSINNNTYIHFPSLGDDTWQEDNADSGQWFEITIGNGYCKLDYISNDSVDGISLIRSVYCGIFEQ